MIQATKRVAAALGAIALSSLVLAGCSGGQETPAASGGSDVVTIDLGSTTVDIPAGTKPEIAMFAGSGIAYQTAYQETVKELAAKYGINITYFDSMFDPTTQLNQVRSAIQDGKYNAFMIENYSGEAACDLLTKDAPAAGIVVSQLTNPTCDQATKPAGDEFWSPGTLNSVGAISTVTYYTAWVREAMKMLGDGDQKVAVLNGPPLVAATLNTDKAFADNDVTPVANLNSDYTTATALKQTSDILQANQDIDAIFTVGPNMTVGVVTALQQAGKKAGEVAVFEVGGTEANAKLVEDGWLTMAVPYTPRTVATTAVDEIIAAFEGKQGAHFLPALNEGTADDPFLITKDTTSSYPYEY